MATKMLKQQLVECTQGQNQLSYESISQIGRDTSLQQTKGLLPMCPLFRGSTVMCSGVESGTLALQPSHHCLHTVMETAV